MKTSDKVVCVDNGKIRKLEINKIYTVRFVDYLTILLEEIPYPPFKSSRFILLSEHRKNKLKKINDSHL